MPSSTSPGSASDVNNWNSYKTDEGFVWSSHIPLVTVGEPVTAWQEAVLRAGERHGILRVVDALNGDFRHDSDGSIVDWLAAHGDRIEPLGTFPAGFLLGRPELYIPASRLAYATAEGMTEAWFTNVADLAGAAGLPRTAETIRRSPSSRPSGTRTTASPSVSPPPPTSGSRTTTRRTASTTAPSTTVPSPPATPPA